MSQRSDYEAYVFECEANNEEPMSYEEWKESEGYRGEYDSDNW